MCEPRGGSIVRQAAVEPVDEWIRRMVSRENNVADGEVVLSLHNLKTEHIIIS